ncbi:MAG: gamma carbonic anhydrase family protein [Methylococcaceae bacterium]|nr:gamma carbonic anhydrase family protein [Methylococcaceae bacterium]
MSTLKSFKGLQPSVGAGVFIDVTARVIGDVILSDHVSIWPMAIVRGDVQQITIGEACNIQDGSVLHVSHDSPYAPGGFSLTLGMGVTVGHRAVLHACTIGDNCLIGIGAVVMDGAVLDNFVMLGAGALVPPGKHLEGGYLYHGSPVRKIRPLTVAEKDYLIYSYQHYKQLKDQYLSEQEQ